jgi:hypothetical protein
MMDGWVSTKWLEKHTKQAAERERRRIRRALRGAMQLIRLEHSQQPDEALDAMDRCIEVSTRAKKGKGRK